MVRVILILHVYYKSILLSGYLGNDVMVYGDWLPRQILGKFTAFCAVLRMIYLTIIVLLFYRSQSDVVVLDGVSAPIPLLRWFGLKVLFYCHFPDLVSFHLHVERLLLYIARFL